MESGDYCNLFGEYLKALAERTGQDPSVHADIEEHLKKPQGIVRLVSLIELALSFRDCTLDKSKADLIADLLGQPSGAE